MKKYKDSDHDKKQTQDFDKSPPQRPPESECTYNSNRNQMGPILPEIKLANFKPNQVIIWM